MLNSSKKHKRTEKHFFFERSFWKDSEETVVLQDAEETITDKQQETHQTQPCIQSGNAQDISKCSQKNWMTQEIILISLDSEK